MIMEITERYESWEIYPALLPYTSCMTLGKRLLISFLNCRVAGKLSVQSVERAWLSDETDVG